MKIRGFISLGLGVPNHTFTRLGQLDKKKEQEQMMLIILFCTIVLLCTTAYKRIIKKKYFLPVRSTQIFCVLFIKTEKVQEHDLY